MIDHSTEISKLSYKSQSQSNLNVKANQSQSKSKVKVNPSQKSIEVKIIHECYNYPCTTKDTARKTIQNFNGLLFDGMLSIKKINHK